MKKLTAINWSLAFMLGAAISGSPLQAEEFRYEPDWESIRSHYEVPEWFRDAKFGIFLHWGPYTVPAYAATKYPKHMYNPNWEQTGKSVYKHHCEHYGDPSEFGYKDFFPLFKAEKFDAKQWVALYAISLNWPDDGVFTIETLAKGNPYESRAIKSVEFISGSSKMNWKHTDQALVIRTEGDKPCEAAYAFRILFSE